VRLVSTTLTGNAAEIVGEALRSVVGWVDTCLVVDTGVTDATLERACDAAGDKLVVRDFPWTGDFSAARNFALDTACEIGGDWSITVDTDERIELHGEDIRAALDRTSLGCIMIGHADGTYAKERLFRLPAAARFAGPTHESFPAHQVGCVTLDKARFVELLKTPEQYRRKFERDAAILADHTRANPKDPRWFYYLGDALHGLRRHEEAISAFTACSALRGWDEEAAWAQYRAAECLCALGRWDDAVGACASGLARHAGIAELSWLGGFASYRAGRHAQAVWWSKASLALGYVQGCGRDVKRIGFRNPAALWEGPYDVLRYALRALGDEEGAKDAEQAYERAKGARVGGAA
jgi:hypothetical protein